MAICDLCGAEILDAGKVCDCGYNPGSGEVGDWKKAKTWAEGAADWFAEIRRKKQIHDLMISKRGHNSTDPGYKGWSMRTTAKCLGVGHSTVQRDFEILEYPDLQACRNASEARERIKSMKHGASKASLIAESEDSLQELIFDRWEQLALGREWSIVGHFRMGKYYAGQIGDMDILAKHKEQENRYLVIELKKDKRPDDAVGQVLRYMGWVKINMAGDQGIVEGCIVCGSLDDRLLYALVPVPSVSLHRYEMDGDSLKSLTEIQVPRSKSEWNCYDIQKEFLSFSTDQQRELLEALEQRRDKNAEQREVPNATA